MGAECEVIETQETHVLDVFPLYPHKNLVGDQIAHHNVFKSSNFTDRFLVPISVRGCPLWRPGFKTRFYESSRGGHEAARFDTYTARATEIAFTMAGTATGQI